MYDVVSSAVGDYENENFLEAVDLIESALPLYLEALDRCQLLCEDMLVMNITETDMNDGMREVLQHYTNSLRPDTLDYHSVFGTAIRELLQCRVRCHDDVARVKGKLLGDYLPHHFHYLQFSYYKRELAYVQFIQHLFQAIQNARTQKITQQFPCLSIFPFPGKHSHTHTRFLPKPFPLSSHSQWGSC